MAKQVKSDDLNNFRLDNMSKRVRCVIDTNKDENGNDLGFGYDMSKIYDELCKDGYLFAYIFHDKDTDNDGVIKRKHLHLVLECPTRRRVSYYIKHLAMMFGVDRSQVQVEVSNNFDWDIQYLIHKNNPEKYQYDGTDIITNMSRSELDERMLTVVHKEVTAKFIFDTVKSCKTKSQVIFRLGLGNANIYKSVIDTFVRDGWLGYDLKSNEAKDIINERNNYGGAETW